MEEMLESTVNAVTENVVDSQETTAETVNADNVDLTSTQAEVPQKAVQTPDENAKYAAVRRDAEAKAEVRARDAVISEMYGETHGIKTYAEYKAAIASEKEAASATALAESQNISEEVAKEILESRKFRTQFETEKRQQKDYADFLQEYPDVKPETIPPSVWESAQNGRPLVEAYKLHENTILKAELEAFKKGAKVQASNITNALSTPSSIIGNGAATADYISPELFESKKSDQRWVIKNLTQIQRSREKW